MIDHPKLSEQVSQLEIELDLALKELKEIRGVLLVNFADYESRKEFRHPSLWTSEEANSKRVYELVFETLDWAFNKRPKENTATLIAAVSTAIKEIEDMHPYKESGNQESYSKYNEGWSDACDLIEQRVIQILK